MKLPSHDTDLCGIAKLRQKLLAVFSSEAECAYVGDIDPDYGIANG
jgi:hypothetical protein